MFSKIPSVRRFLPVTKPLSGVELRDIAQIFMRSREGPGKAPGHNQNRLAQRRGDAEMTGMRNALNPASLRET